MVRMPACHAGGRGFEPLPGRQNNASVAQSVEQWTENPRVGGSIPPRGTIIFYVEGFPSGQRGQTVNLLAQPSMVRIHLPPPYAKVVELADALDSGSSGSNTVRVRLPPFAPS
jgi:hypothetical protein